MREVTLTGSEFRELIEIKIKWDTIIKHEKERYEKQDDFWIDTDFISNIMGLNILQDEAHERFLKQHEEEKKEAERISESLHAQVNDQFNNNLNEY